jgi:O-antigen/teichoic acid export membrane protein
MLRNTKEKWIKMLRWSEKYTKTDMVYFFKGNFWLNVNRASSVINGLALSVAFAHLLTKETYGTYAFALAVLGVFSMPQTTGLGNGIVKGVARGNHHVVFEGLRKVLPWSILGAIALGLIGVYYYVMGNFTLGVCFFVGALVLPIAIMNSAAKSFFLAKGNFQFPARFNLIRTPIMTLTLITAAWLTKSPLVIVVAHTLGNVILGSLMYRAMTKRYDLSAIGEKPEPFASRYAFHSGLLSIFSYLSEQLDDILLWKFVGAAPVATYSYATTPVRELKALAENQSVLALSKFAQKDLGDVRANLLFRIKQMYWIVVPLIVIYILCAPLIFKYLFPRYIDAVALSQLASLALLTTPRKLMSSAILAHQRIRESYIMIMLPNAFRIILALTLIPIWSVKGAVAALLIAEVLDYGVLGLLMRSLAKKQTN